MQGAPLARDGVRGPGFGGVFLVLLTRNHVLLDQTNVLWRAEALNLAVHFLREEDFCLGAGRHTGRQRFVGAFYKPWEARGKGFTKAAQLGAMCQGKQAAVEPSLPASLPAGRLQGSALGT